MSDETKILEQSYHYQTDQQVSINGYFDVEINGETVKFQVTNRYGASPEKIVKTVKAAIDAFAMLRQEFPRQFIKPPEMSQEPVRHPIDDSGHAIPAIQKTVAERLSVEMKDGKFYYKVIAKPYTKFGITVWDETLKAAGVVVDHANPQNTPNISGWNVEYILNDQGKPQKVTRLLPAGSPF